MTRREIVLVIILLAAVAATAYYFLFYTRFNIEYNSAIEELSAKEAQIVEAEIRQSVYEAQKAELDAAQRGYDESVKSLEAKNLQREILEDVWREFEESVPMDFDQPGSLYDIQDIIYKHTETVSVSYIDIEPSTDTASEAEPDSALEELAAQVEALQEPAEEEAAAEEEREEVPIPNIDYIKTLSISLSFAVSYDAMLEIANDIEALEHNNRTVTYSYSRSENAETEEEEYNVTMTVDFLMLKPEAIYHANHGIS